MELKTFYLRVLLVGMFLVFVYQSATAQDPILEKTIQIKFKSTNVSDALDEISKKTGYFFIYPSDILKDVTSFSSPVEPQSLKNLLQSFFKDIDVDFKVVNKHVVISKSNKLKLKPNEISDSISFLTIEGQILDSETKEYLPFAAIGLEGTNQGSISNMEGSFSLKVPLNLQNGLLRIAHIGYKPKNIKITEIKQGRNIIYLPRDIISLPEIVIRNEDPQKLVARLHKNIEKNYPHTPARVLGFYREACSCNKKYYLISEGAVDIYKSAYNALIDNDQIKILKTRKVFNPDVSDTLIVRLKAGLRSCLQLDLVKNIPEFIIPENFETYDFRLDDITNFNEETVYVVHFIQKKSVQDPLFCGKLFINKKNAALLCADIELNPQNIVKVKNDFVLKNKIKVKISLEQVKYRIEYKQINTKYYLSHVRGDLDFRVKKRNRLFSSNYHVFFELASTDFDTIQAQRHKRKQADQIDEVFSTIVTGYDPSFWGQSNIIEPEHPIEEALIEYSEKIKTKLLDKGKP